MRQSGELLEKLKQKHLNSTAVIPLEEPVTGIDPNASFMEVSEANAELVRSSAKLSFEDTETENFYLIPEQTHANNSKEQFNDIGNNIEHSESLKELLNSNFEDFIDSIPVEEKNVPSPSDILKKLCLSQEEEITGQNEHGLESYDILKEFL